MRLRTNLVRHRGRRPTQYARG